MSPTSSVATKLVDDVFRKYLKSTRGFWRVAQRRAVKQAPNARPLLLKAFRLQLVLIDHQAMRFGYLLEGDTPDWRAFKTLNSITDRLNKGWSEVEETSLLSRNSFYREIVEEMKTLQSELDSKALGAPLRELQSDANYLDARRSLAERVQVLDDQLRQNL